MRVLISGGGTGGHVYPALAVVEQLDQVAGDRQSKAAAEERPAANEKPRADVPAPKAEKHADRDRANRPNVLWIGSTGGMEERLVERAAIEYRGIETGQLRGINPVRAAANVGRMMNGIGQSRAIIRSYAPHVCLVTGGYVCAPVVIACRLMSIPVLIYLPDMSPGWAIQRLSRLATRVAVTLPAAAAWFGGEVPQGKAVVTGYPVRKELIDAASDRSASRRKLAAQLERPLDGTDPLVLIWGGSQGSRSINQATWSALEEWLPRTQILHVVGQRDWPIFEQATIVESLPQEIRNRYHPVPYLHESMPVALAASDVTIARAGASSLGEFPVAGLPSILVPLPFGGVNQVRNAEQLVNAGAAIIVEDGKLAVELAPALISLLQDEEKRAKMSAAASALARPDAALNIARQLRLLAESRPGEPARQIGQYS